MLRKIVSISVVFFMVCAVFSVMTASAQKGQTPIKDQVFGRCIEPIRPMLPMKPFWCQGQWVQQLVCDGNCNCYWQAVCLQ